MDLGMGFGMDCGPVTDLTFARMGVLSSTSMTDSAWKSATVGRSEQGQERRQTQQ